VPDGGGPGSRGGPLPARGSRPTAGGSGGNTPPPPRRNRGAGTLAGHRGCGNRRKPARSAPGRRHDRGHHSRQKTDRRRHDRPHGRGQGRGDPSLPGDDRICTFVHVRLYQKGVGSVVEQTDRGRARRRAIVEAAAALIAEQGSVDLTPRRVEALQHLADQLDEELAEVRRALADSGGDPVALARTLHAYLSDRAQVRADAALYFAGARSPELRPLALRWFDGLVEILSAHTGP